VLLLHEFALRAPWNSQSLSSPGRFTSADLLRISEIGLAVPDVAAAVESLQTELPSQGGVASFLGVSVCIPLRRFTVR
jgi:hypothetical protein